MLDQNKRQAEFLNILEYHEKGYRGKGINIAVYDMNFNINDIPNKERFKNVHPFGDEEYSLNQWREDGNDHGVIVLDVIRQIAPDANVHFYGGRSYNDFLSKLSRRDDIDLATISMSGDTTLTFLMNRMADIPIFASAGNNGEERDVRFPAKHDKVIAVASLTKRARDNIQRSDYSTIGEAVEVASLNGWRVEGLNGERYFRGTSCTTPVVASMFALFMEANRKIGLKETRSLIRDNVMNLYEDGRDVKAGYGLFKLPKEIPYEPLNGSDTSIKDDKKEDKSSIDFKDTGSHWAKDAIDNLSKNGIITGYDDNTIRPNKNITRAEFFTIVDRYLNGK